MLVRNWMTDKLFTANPDTSLLKLGKMMKDHDIRRIPIVDKNNILVGIVSDRDIRDASPSKATTLDMYEIHYLLAEIKAKDIMTSKPKTIKPTDTVEKAAMIMLDHKIGGLPVVGEDNKIVGIISEQDVFKALVMTTGVREGGFQLALDIPDKPGSMRPIFDLLRQRGARIISVLSINNETGERTIFIRLRDMASRESEEELVEAVKQIARLQYWARNEVHLN